MMIAWRSFGVAVICVLPFIIMNALVATPVPAFVAWIRPTGHTSALEWLLLWGSIGFIFIGAWVSLRALWHQRRVVLLNGILGVALLIVGSALVFTLGAEIIACEWYGVPNCD